MLRARDSGRRPVRRLAEWLRPRTFALAVVMLVAAAAYFTWRGVYRGVIDSGDLAVGYSAGRAWLQGLDPYDVTVLTDALREAGGADIATSGLLTELRNVYVPTTLPVLAVLALVSWPAAKLLFVGVNVASVVLVIVALRILLRWRTWSAGSVSLAALVLALAPVHTTIASGQTAVVATAGLLAAVSLERAGRPGAAGAAYGLASAVKVQIGGPFVAYLVWVRRWAVVGAFAAVFGGLTVVAVARMHVAGVPWLNSWFANLAALSGPGGINDPSVLNPERYSLINLQVLLHSLGTAGIWTDLVTYVLIGGAALLMVFLARAVKEQELLVLAFVAVAGLLVAYHRYYDAVLLVFPIGWALGALGGPRRNEGLLVLLFAADFLLPFQTALHDLAQNGRVPTWLVDSPLWEAVLMTQHVWALTGIGIVLLVAAARHRRDGQSVVVSSAGRS